MKRVRFILRGSWHILLEFIMLFPPLFLFSTMMSPPMNWIFFASLFGFAVLGLLMRQFIPFAIVQLGLGIPICVAAALWLGMTYGVRTEPIVYALPALFAPAVFYRGKQHGQNDWNVILPTYAPCFVMILNCVVMALLDFLGTLEQYTMIITPMAALAAVVSFFSMNALHRRDLADEHRAGQRANAVSRSLAGQNRALVLLTLAAGILLSFMPFVMDAVKWVLNIVKTVIGWIIGLILALVPEMGGKVNTGEEATPEYMEMPPSDPDYWLNIIATIIGVLAAIGLLILICIAIRKGVRLLRELLGRMMDQQGSISDEDNGFEDTRERLVELRDLPRRYADALKARLAAMRREKSWRELETEGERVRYLYRHSLRRAGKSGYRHHTSYTPHEALHEAAQDHKPLEPVEGELAAQYDLVRYAEREPQPGHAERIREQAGLS